MARSWRAALLLLAGLLFVYHVNLRQVSTDTAASRLVPISLLRNASFVLDDLLGEAALPFRAGGPLPHYLFEHDGHLYDAYPPVGPLLAVPVYALPVAIGWPSDTKLLADVFSKVAASLFAALSALVLWRALIRLGHGPRVAMTAALLYGLATPVWSTASQGLWTHSPALLASSVALWALSTKRAGLALTAAAVAGLARPVLLLVLPVLLVVAVWSPRGAAAAEPLTQGAAMARRAWRASAGAIAVIATVIFYNLRVLGTPLEVAAYRNTHWNAVFGVTGMWQGNWLEGLLGLTVSPSRGLLVYSPILVLALVGAWSAFRPSVDRPDAWRARVERTCCAAIIVSYVVYAKFLVWWAGHAYGPRYLTDVMPYAAVLLAAGLERSRILAESGSPGGAAARRTGIRWARVGVATLAGYSIAVQAIGAFCWPSPLDGRIDRAYYERLWSIREMQIVQCLRSGPILDPFARRVLWTLGAPVELRSPRAGRLGDGAELSQPP